MNYSMKNYKLKKTCKFFMRKALKNIWIIVLSIMLSASISMAQNETKNQAYLIHEDRVKPSMVSEYEKISKDLVAECTKYNIQETSWLTVAQNDNTYLYVTPIEKFAELDANVFATLGEKMGNDNMNKLFSRFNSCYDEHGDYIVYLNKDLSYMPGGITQVTEGKPYRLFYYNYVTPDTSKKFVSVLKKIKDVFAKSNSKLFYRVYSTGFGVMGTYYMVVISAANAEEMAKSSGENWELTKDQFQPLLTELNKYIWKTDEKRGWIRSDLSYTPK